MRRNKKVLIVDNDEHVSCAIQKALEHAGFDALKTWSGWEALTRLQSHAFGVLVVDNYLPDLHADDFLERVARLAIQPWIIVTHAGLPTPHSLQRYTALGASAVVPKGDAAAICKAVESGCGPIS